MNNDDFLRCSFAASIAFALLTLGGLLVAGLVLGERGAVALGLLACAFAYLAQSSFTHGADRAGCWLQFASVVAWVVGFIFLL